VAEEETAELAELWLRSNSPGGRLASNREGAGMGTGSQALRERGAAAAAAETICGVSVVEQTDKRGELDGQLQVMVEQKPLCTEADATLIRGAAQDGRGAL
jgi:hypothetical protein